MLNISIYNNSGCYSVVAATLAIQEEVRENQSIPKDLIWQTRVHLQTRNMASEKGEVKLQTQEKGQANSTIPWLARFSDQSR